MKRALERPGVFKYFYSLYSQKILVYGLNNWNQL